MKKKIIILAPSAGGKSTLLRYLRESSSFPIYEMDEEVMLANDNRWPDDNSFKDKVLVPQITKRIMEKSEAVYLTSYVPEDLIKHARVKKFEIVLINVSMAELQRRNKKRMQSEDYEDSTPWLQLQLDNFAGLVRRGLIDRQIDGQKDEKTLAEEIRHLIS